MKCVCQAGHGGEVVECAYPPWRPWTQAVHAHASRAGGEGGCGVRYLALDMVWRAGGFMTVKCVCKQVTDQVFYRALVPVPAMYAGRTCIRCVLVAMEGMAYFALGVPGVSCTWVRHGRFSF